MAEDILEETGTAKQERQKYFCQQDGEPSEESFK